MRLVEAQERRNGLSLLTVFAAAELARTELGAILRKQPKTASGTLARTRYAGDWKHVLLFSGPRWVQQVSPLIMHSQCMTLQILDISPGQAQSTSHTAGWFSALSPGVQQVCSRLVTTAG